ncbi:MAG TPA: hypothetical protein VFJ15_11650 [Oleiagrimonas sp.]|nr:hypothetical protein [Oleiagrimonas sp.]
MELPSHGANHEQAIILGQAWQASDQTQRAYCDAQAISLPSFSYWRHKLKVRAAPEAKGMMPIAVTTSDTSMATLEVVLPNYLTLRVPLTADPAQVVRWVQGLGAC